MAHRYWRVRITRAYVTTITAAEVEFRETPGGADVTGAGTASASSTFSGSAAGAFANDSNTTFWSVAASTTLNGMNEWLAYDFGAGNEKDIVEFAWTISTTASRNPRDCLLEFSDDGVFWSPYGNPFVEIAAAASNSTTVYTASGTDAETIPKIGAFVVGALWPFDSTTVWKTGYQIVLETEGAVVAKNGYFTVIGPTDGLKVADFSGYVAFERLPSIQVADINGYVVFRPIPTPPRKTIVIIGPGTGFGGSGVDNPLVGHLVQDEEFSAMLRLPQNMAGVVEQDTNFVADLFVDNAVEDIFLIGDLEQTGDLEGTVYIPHFLGGDISQETVFDADLFVDASVTDQFLEGNIEQSQTMVGALSFTVAMQGNIDQTSVVDGAIEEALEAIPPDSFANLLYWFDADDVSTLTKTGNLVDAWGDKSPGARDAVSTDTWRPDHGTTTINGKPVVTFPTSVKYLQANWSSVTDMTHTIVLRTTSTASSGAWYLSPFIFGRDAPDVANDFAIYMSDGYVAMQVRDGANPAAKTLGQLNDGEVHVVTISRSAAGVEKIYVDGVLETTGTLNAAAINAISNVQIGNGFVGDVAEIFSYDVTRTDEEVLALHAYAMTKWFASSQLLEGTISQSAVVDGSLAIDANLEGTIEQTNPFDTSLAVTSYLEGIIEQTTSLSGNIDAAVAPEAETIPYEKTFSSTAQITDFERRVTALDFLNETFTTDTGQFTYATEGTLGTPFAFTDGQGVLVHSASRNSIAFNGVDIQIPQAWVQMDMVSRAVNPTGYDVIGVGVGLDGNNFIVGVLDRRNNILRAQVKIGGSNTNYINLAYTATTPGQIGVGIVNSTISIWTTDSIGGAWTLRGSADFSAQVDFRDTDLTGWQSCIFLATGAAQTWTLDNFIGSRFGTVGMRDITLISHEDGSPVDFSGKFRFTASMSHTNAASYSAVVEYDPVTEAVQIVGIHYVDRDGKLYNDLASHLVKNDDNTFRYLTSSWGNGFGNVIQILHKDNVGDITSGVHVISGMTQLSLPLIPGTGDGGAYDPYLIKYEGEWILAYAVVDDTTFAGEHFYIAAASSTDMSSFTGIGSDSSREQVEGPKIVVANGIPYIHGGGRGEHPTYDITMTYLGEPTFSPTLYNGVDTQPHIQIVPYNDTWLAFTWNQVRFNSVAFTWGDFCVYEASRVIFKLLLTQLDELEDPSYLLLSGDQDGKLILSGDQNA